MAKQAPVARHEIAKFYCPACLPRELLGIVAKDVADLPNDDGCSAA